MALGNDGIELVPGLLGPADCQILAARLGPVRADGAGSRRLLEEPWCQVLAARLMAHEAVRRALPPRPRAVQCTLFEKSLTRNWLVATHQDLSIPVSWRFDHPGLTGWSEKEGATFVHAPEAVLTELLAVRLHVDDCGPADGPLRVVPGSHRLGRVDPAQAARLGQSAAVPVPARQGDVLLMRPLTLHASSKSTGTGLRRVLHFVIGPEALPCGLAW